MKAAVDQQVSLAPSIEDIRAQFPILHQQVNGKQLIYFDNAATTQKPSMVVEAISNYYNQYNANIHRGIHALAEKATAAYEETRLEIQKFLNAPEAEEIIFTSGTTSGINLVSNGYGRKFLQPGDEVLISEMEHHANIVPWQMICQEKGARLKVVPIDDEGNLMMDAFQKLLTKKNKDCSDQPHFQYPWHHQSCERNCSHVA
jgi:cysteine desulfurase/selenocysteine lyase